MSILPVGNSTTEKNSHFSGGVGGGVCEITGWRGYTL